ncbi:MAG: hypothetical protein ACI8TE_000730 [Francisella sp.]
MVFELIVKRDCLKKIFIFMLVFCILFDPQVPFLPNGVGFSFLVVIILIPFVMSQKFRINNFYEFVYYKNYFIIFMILLLYIVFMICLHQSDIAFLLSWCKAFVLFCAFYFVYSLFLKDSSPSYLFKILLCAFVFNALVNIVAGTFYNTFDFLNIFHGAGISDSLGKNYYRHSFITGSSYFSIGTAYGVFCILFMSHIVKNNKYSVPILLLFSLVCLSGFVAARTSGIAIILSVMYLFLSKPSKFLKLLVIGMICVFVLISLPNMSKYSNWMLSFFDLAHNGSANYVIHKMYFWPGLDIFIYGTGYSHPGAFIYSDGGYMNDILFGGIVFAIVKISFLLMFFRAFFKSNKFIITIICVSILLFNFKGLFMYNNAQGMAIFYFTSLYFLKLREDSR